MTLKTLKNNETDTFGHDSQRAGGCGCRAGAAALCCQAVGTVALSETDFIRRQLHDIIRYCWDQGFCWFICGGALGFDTLAAEEVIRFRTDEEQDAG